MDLDEKTWRQLKAVAETAIPALETVRDTALGNLVAQTAIDALERIDYVLSQSWQGD